MAQSTKHFTHAGAHVLTEADGVDATAPPPSEPEGFPLHAMRMKDFLALDKLRPHNALKKEGLVVALDFDGAHKDAKLNFVSHQWLAYAEADPNGDHLKTMQDVFRRIMAGESIFRSEDDWSAYTKGSNEENARWNPHAWSISPEEFTTSISEGWVWIRVEINRGICTPSSRCSYGDNIASMAWGVRNLISTQVWMDYISIPQVIGCTKDEVASVLADQKAAIRAIPSYVRHAQHFWICAPSGAQHVDTCCECNYDTWHSRGWCRMEEAALNLERLGDGRALLVTQPLGEEPAVSTFDKIDRAWNKTQRSNSPLTGAYSCCRMNHVVVSKDGAKTSIGCDKVALKGVLHTLFDRKVAEIREACKEEGSYKLDLEWTERMNHSNSEGVGAYRNLWFLVALKPMQLADTVDEIDYVGRGWSKPFDELTNEDYETFCREGNGHQGGLECDPERDLDTVAWNAANMGHLPMLRYCIEKMGADPNYSNHYHMSMLLMTGRFGHDSCLRYLCSKLTKEQIDHTSGGLGLSAIGDAAKCGHAKCIRTLLSLGAAVDPRRKNGKMPLHEACANGHVECVQCLVDGGADVNAVDNNGNQPVDLAMASVTNREAVLEVLRAADATLRAAHATLMSSAAGACDACADDGCAACADK